MWPKIAAYFELEVPAPQAFGLAKLMPAHQAVWEELVKLHELKPIPYSQLATWTFGDYIFQHTWDNFLDVTKLRKAGFDKMKIDSGEMFLRQFDELRANRIIP